jgi:hypothetical protein
MLTFTTDPIEKEEGLSITSSSLKLPLVFQPTCALNTVASQGQKHHNVQPWND